MSTVAYSALLASCFRVFRPKPFQFSPLGLPCPTGPHDCIGQSLALMEARAVLAVLVGRFHLHCPASREEVRASEVMKLTLQCAGGMQLHLKLRE